MNDSVYIKICLQQVENKLQWKPSTDWTDSDYRKLSNMVQDLSGISISHQTLKRLFGKVDYKDQYNPQQATKDALSKFLGFSDWNDFINKNKQEEKEPETPELPERSSFGSIWKLLAFISVVISAAVVIFFLIPNDHFSITAKNPVGNIPHTVEFDYDISGINADSVFIDMGYTQQSLGYQKFLLDKKKKRFNHCFQIPNLYKARLVANNKILAEIPIQVCSQGWANLFRGTNFSKEGNGKSKDIAVYQFGLDDFIIDTVSDGFLYFAPQTLLDHGMEARKVYYIECRNIRKFDAVADSCTFEIRFRNRPEDGGISCFDSRFIILGKTGSADVMLVQKGCSRWSLLRVGEMVKDGQYEDMSDMNFDPGQWTVLKMQIRNKEAKIIRGSDTLYKCNYHQPIDSVMGLLLYFKGSAMVDHVKLLNDKDSVVYQDEF